jgi:hypothetical protein
MAIDTLNHSVTDRRSCRRLLAGICVLYLLPALIFGSAGLDFDEFSFVAEPYQLLGGDYTAGYVGQGDYAAAASTALKSYYLFWNYRPISSPLIPPEDKQLFAQEERKFGYVNPGSISQADREAFAKYKRRLIVPEPDRFYAHGAGKPLLPALLSIPQLALVKLVTPVNTNLLHYQYTYNYHPIFILTRLVQLLSGLACVILVYVILAREYDERRALLGATVVAVFPICVKYFPNLHHDSILVPLFVGALYCFYQGRYKSAGVLCGLALASKNVAIVLLPLFLAYTLFAVWDMHRRQPTGQAGLRNEKFRGLGLTVVLAGVALLPFANPVSYAKEILTPVTHPVYDRRGESVDQFTLSALFSQPPASRVTSTIRPEVGFLQLLLRFQNTDFFFVVVAILAVASRLRTGWVGLSLAVLLASFPYGLVFGYGLSYRSLLYVPFMAMLCVEFSGKRQLVALIAVLLFIDAFYCIDPLTTDEIHHAVGDQRLWTNWFEAVGHN